MPIKVIYNPDGDLEKEDELRSYALTQHFVLKDLMKFNKLKQDQRFVNLVGGGSISIKSCWDDDVIKIYWPKPFDLERLHLERAMIASACWVDNGMSISYASFMVWDCAKGEKADLSFANPCQYFGNPDVAAWLGQHFSWYAINTNDYTVDTDENTITAPGFDFLPAEYLGADLSIRPGYFVRVAGSEPRVTRVLGVSEHTLKLADVSVLYFNGYYHQFDLGYSVRMFTTDGGAVNGCGVSNSGRELYSNWAYCTDTHQAQSYIDLWGSPGLQQSKQIPATGRRWRTPYTFESNSSFAAAINESIEFAEANSGWSGIGVIPHYQSTGLYRFDKNIDR